MHRTASGSSPNRSYTEAHTKAQCRWASSTLSSSRTLERGLCIAWRTGEEMTQHHFPRLKSRLLNTRTSAIIRSQWDDPNKPVGLHSWSIKRWLCRIRSINIKNGEYVRVRLATRKHTQKYGAIKTSPLGFCNVEFNNAPTGLPLSWIRGRRKSSSPSFLDKVGTWTVEEWLSTILIVLNHVCWIQGLKQ